MNDLLRLTPSDIQIRGMACPHSLRHPLFRRRWFADDVIITCVRWYLRFKLSYRDLAELARELGVSVAPSTILRWVVRYGRARHLAQVRVTSLSCATIIGRRAQLPSAI